MLLSRGGERDDVYLSNVFVIKLTALCRYIG